jgi:hypothetical protein
VQNGGGTVLASPRIVPVFFPGETDAATITDAVTRYAASSEWTAATAQYGVAAATVATPVMSADALPDGLKTPALGAWIEAHLDGTHPEWGPADQPTIASSIYLLYPPAGVTIYAPQSDPTFPFTPSLCGSHAWDPAGWHWQTTPAPGPNIPVIFAVVGRCTFDATSVSLQDHVTAGTSHELVEAATDPLFLTSPAYARVDDAHAFWMELTGGGEVADLCAQDAADLVKPPDVGYVVQRTWSNAAAAAGHDPCVPARGVAYFSVSADAPDVFYDAFAGVAVGGVAIPPGKSRTIDLHLYSDAPTEAWKVAAVDPNAAAGGATLLTMTLDRDTGKNGDVLHLTIAPQFQGHDATALYEVDSTLGGVTQRWYGEIVVR